jgi:SecD/SecF fusion protein
MRHLIRNSFIVLAAIVLGLLAIYPPSKQLRLGKDLAGGTSLTYQVNLRPGDPPDTMAKMVDLLKRRIDPNGLMEISITVQGNNRLEITMPLPGPEIKKLRAVVDEELAKLGQGSIAPEAFQRMLALEPAPRAAELQKLAAGDAQRLTLLNDAAAKYDAAATARKDFNDRRAPLEAAIDQAQAVLDGARARPDPDDVIKAKADAVEAAREALFAAAAAPAKAEQEFEQARSKAVSTVLSVSEVRRALELSKEPRRYKDSAGAQQAIPSPRERALSRLEQRHPESKNQLASVVAAFDRYQAGRSTLDDPQDLVRLLRGAGVLNFRISVDPGKIADENRLRDDLRRQGPRSARSAEARWYKINKIDSWFDTNEQAQVLFSNPAGFFLGRGYVVEEFDGQYYMLCWDVPGKRLTAAEGAWRLDSARQSQDELGRLAIAFSMDTLGASRMGELTSNNLQQRMAVVLDDEVYTAPNIQSRISGQGQITGSFSLDEVNYIVRVLSAGSLAAKLSPEPISVNTIAPDLGADNLSRGLYAGIIAFTLVAAFMTVYYFSCGFIAILALLVNALLILALMSLNRAAFTLPGIAGVILTFGMAVDANVLIYERMREELLHGADLRTAVRQGYAKALAAIVDGNLTNLIVCVVLGLVGTQEIRGFAITMSIGTITTLFAQLFVTRVIFTYLAEKIRWKTVSMLPLAIPALQRALTFNVDWMRYRWFFAAISITLTGASFIVLVYRGSDVLDNQFRGGTKVTIQLRETAPGQRATLTREQVEDRIIDLATKAQSSSDPKQRQLVQLKPPQISVINPAADGVTASAFEIKTILTDGEFVQGAISQAFQDVMQTQPALRFKGQELVDPRVIPVRPVVSANLGETLGRPGPNINTPDFVGGAAILIENLEPKPTLKSLEDRLNTARQRADNAETALRPHRFVVLEGDEKAVTSCVLLVNDESASYLADPDRWTAAVKIPEWRLAVDLLTSSSSLASMESFSPSIAATFTAQAIIAVLLSTVLVIIYVWVRFASFRYSAAAVATSLHDSLVATGAIAAAALIYNAFPGFARAAGILPFKIDLNVIAAILTILGYSLNDTIIVMDRIREMKGKLPHATRSIINRSINQTISRTIITAGTTFIATLVLYFYGGEAVRAFAFSFVIGIIVGTYSSIAVAAPIIWKHNEFEHHDDDSRVLQQAIAGTLNQVNGQAAPNPATP